MKISDIIFNEEYTHANVDLSLDFNRLTTNINEASINDILFITPSVELNTDKIISNTPLAVVCSQNTVLSDNICYIRVEDVRIALANAYFRYEKIDLKKSVFIGVTGTNGKTSTATLIKNILSKSSHKIGFIGTGKIEISGMNIAPENYSMTTPPPSLLYSSIRQMQDCKCDTIVMEVSSHALAQGRVFPIKFDYGIFTNLSPEHLDYHLNMDDYFDAKMNLLKKSKCSIINVDDKYGQKAYSLLQGKKISVGAVKKADVWANEIENLRLEGIKYNLNDNLGWSDINLPIPGIFNVYNSLLAATVCINLGIDKKEISAALSETNAIEGRYEIINDEITVIIDYAHTSEAFECILRELYYLKKGRKLTVVFGCGGERDKKKRPVMAKTAEKYADKIILTSDNSRNEDPMKIIEDVKRGFTKNKYKTIIFRDEAIVTAIKEANKGDIIAIIGKGAERYNIDKSGYHYFNEKEVVSSALKRRKENL